LTTTDDQNGGFSLRRDTKADLIVSRRRRKIKIFAVATHPLSLSLSFSLSHLILALSLSQTDTQINEGRISSLLHTLTFLTEMIVSQ